jgi:hypothetical protein
LPLVMARPPFETDGGRYVLRTGHRETGNLEVLAAPQSLKEAASLERMSPTPLIFNLLNH